MPAEKPYFQVAVMLTRSPDPMAGKPGLAREQTDSIMQRNMFRFKQCYDYALEEDPNLKGQIVLKVVIGPAGSVSEASLLRKMGNGTFDTCALTVARSLQFPKPYKGKPVTLNHPMAFSPAHGTRRRGKLTRTQIDGAFSRARYDFKRCYESRLKAKPQLHGKIVIAFTVRPDGGVTKVRLTEDQPADLTLSNCVLKRAKELRFPRPEHGGEVDLEYPLNFEPPAKKSK